MFGLVWVLQNLLRFRFFGLCCLLHMLEMTYFRAEMILLIVSRSDSTRSAEITKNTLTVDPIMLVRR